MSMQANVLFFNGYEQNLEKNNFDFCFHLPVNLPNSSSISSLPFDLGMFPTKRRRFGTLMLIFKHLPGFIS